MSHRLCNRYDVDAGFNTLQALTFDITAQIVSHNRPTQLLLQLALKVAKSDFEQ